MPGLIGFTRRRGDDDLDILRKMQEMIKHQSFYVDDPLFSDPHLCATRTHKAIVQKEVQPFVDEGLHVWLKGEFYNQDKLVLASSSDARRLSDPAILARLYRENEDVSFLRQIDGIYSAVLYDAARKSVHLITDRYGFGYLYWTVQGGTLLWASEMKAFLAHSLFEPRIDPKTLNDFFGVGYPIESDSWFEGVKLVPPGTMLSWDLREEKLTERVYWSWADIHPLTGPADEHELAEELGRLWVNSVERRSNMGGNVGVTLSGGLDSRAIVAALPDFDYPIQSVTVGNPYCDDVRIARRVATRRGLGHHTYEIGEHNWFEHRLNAVWWSDGHYDIKHMHGCVVIDKIRELYDINISGVVGGTIMGSAYLTRANGDREEEFSQLSSRGRRFSPCMIQTIDDVFFHSRLPFADNELIELMISIPSELRMDYRIYKHMLLYAFPDLFRDIPWQKTGLTIDASKIRYKMKDMSDKISGKSKRIFRKIGVDVDNIKWFTGYNYHNYAYWIRQDPSRTIIDNILASPSALYPNFIDRELVGQAWSDHKEGRNRTRKIFQYLTFEVWLQQVFTGRYRDGLVEDHAHKRRTVTGRTEISVA